MKKKPQLKLNWTGKKVLIISDLHLMPTFSKAQETHILNVVDKYEHIIVNGDLFELSMFADRNPYNSKWKNLLNILIKKKFIYIFGNHDRKDNMSPEFVTTISQIYESVLLEHGDNTYFVIHGNQLQEIKYLEKLIQNFEAKRKANVNESKIMMKLVNVFGWKFWRAFGGWMNKWHKILHAKQAYYIVVGHTHFPELDHIKKYINSGNNMFGLSSYIELTENGKVILIKTKYPFGQIG